MVLRLDSFKNHLSVTIVNTILASLKNNRFVINVNITHNLSHCVTFILSSHNPAFADFITLFLENDIGIFFLFIVYSTFSLKYHQYRRAMFSASQFLEANTTKKDNG